MTGKKGRPRTSVNERFWAKVIRSESCWTWTGSKNKLGYGRFKNSRDKNRYAHRIAWQLVFGAIPQGRVVAHACDNPGCVNPEHLWLARQGDNLNDAEEKGRLDRKTSRW